MKFVDSCEVDVVAGKGGNGSIAFRREKFVPFGGPSGGDGGRGGDVVFVADEGLSTLLDLTYGRVIRAPNGEQGHGKDMYGRGGEDRVVRVPVGTQIRDRETGELLFDISTSQARVVVAKGGKGGRGNIHFATPYDRAPRRAEPGAEGEERKLRLELKVMADVGLLGFPNVGKSTFIRAVSRARPKVADYPFTTLTPSSRRLRIGDEASFVVADIPGLIPGAAEGAGLGHRFLKHVERTRALLHLVTLDFDEGRDPVADYDALMTELERFDPELAERPQIVAMTKSDLPEVREAYEQVRARFAKRDITLHLVSAATGEGVRELSIALYKLVTGQSEIEDWARPAPAPRVAGAADAADRAPASEAGAGAPATSASVAEDADTTSSVATSAEKTATTTTPGVARAAKEGAAKKTAAAATAAPAKKKAAKKTAKKTAATAKKTAAKKPTAKKPAATTKKAATKKTAATRTAAKKSAAKTSAAKKPSAKKPAATAKKAAANKAAASKTAANKAAASKTAAKKAAASKTAAKKAAATKKAPSVTRATKRTAGKTSARKGAAKRKR
ncbi:MAG: GTPase ObgE [Labilithrix sp.]|nr:GTPase ObgE [Labilithrix sp.]